MTVLIFGWAREAQCLGPGVYKNLLANKREIFLNSCVEKSIFLYLFIYYLFLVRGKTFRIPHHDANVGGNFEEMQNLTFFSFRLVTLDHRQTDWLTDIWSYIFLSSLLTFSPQREDRLKTLKKVSSSFKRTFYLTNF